MSPKTTSKKTVAETFDPKVLDSTMVAIPLLQAIADVKEAQRWMEHHGKLRVENFNAVIFFARDYPEGIRAAQSQVEDMLEQILSQLDALSKENRLLQKAPDAREKRTFTVAFLERRARIALLDRDRKQEFRAIDRLRPVYFDIIIDVNLNYPAGRKEACKWIISALKNILASSAPETEAVLKDKGDAGDQYVFARLRAEHINALLEQDELNAARVREQLDVRGGSCRAIHGIWPDFAIKPCITDSIATVKADAALNSFSTMGDGITWAVIDSGIAAEHPHFDLHHNIDSKSPLHRDFTKDVIGIGTSLQDAFGHGTHVAGIIAGEYESSLSEDKRALNAVRRCRVRPTAQESDVEKIRMPIGHIRGMAPKCQLVSLKVLDEVGYGEVSNVIAALNYILDVNNSGRSELKIHGVNISLGYEFEPEWFACGESPICMEVNRVVRSGVPVVVAAGNTGYGTVASRERSTGVGLDLTINDPGNAEFAITVGSTHRDMPHRYGVSFFSSKGPTGDGRPKPDLVAPGEKILSCAAGALLQDRAPGEKDFHDKDGIHYVEDSGTSMAAPHVSGIIAGLLSVRREFIGKPEQVKEILCTTATDLKRDRYFQGAGLVDLMRSIQSI